MAIRGISLYKVFKTITSVTYTHLSFSFSCIVNYLDSDSSGKRRYLTILRDTSYPQNIQAELDEIKKDEVSVYTTFVNGICSLSHSSILSDV